MNSEPRPCGRLLILWDGEYEMDCDLVEGHAGPHHAADDARWVNHDDGTVSYTFDDEPLAGDA